jgi:hypothetical protein
MSFLPSCVKRSFVFRTARALFPALLAFAALAPERAPAQSFDDGGSGRLSPKAAQGVLEKFRQFGITDTCFRFTLTHVPRRGGNEVVHNGVIWTSWYNDGPVFRVELTAANAKGAAAAPVRFILQSGRNPSLWQLDASGKPARVVGLASKPFLPGLIITPLELQQPFTFWKDARYLETRRFRGRPTHFFQMNPPEDFKLAQPEIGFVRIGIDKGYERVLMQAMVYDAKGEELRKLEVEGFTKVKEFYIPEELRFHDQVTRDKDIFVVRQAAVGLHPKDFPKELIFHPRTLNKPAPQPDEKLFEKVN